MSSTAGLSRRRVAQASSTSGTTAESSNGNGSSSTPAPTGSHQHPNGNGGLGHAGTAMEGGNKIAYDPRDLDNDNEDKRMPKLTILEEILLLGLKDQQVRINPTLYCAP